MKLNEQRLTAYQWDHLYDENMWSHPRVVKAFTKHRNDMDFKAWDKTLRGNSLVFNKAIKNLLLIYDGSTVDALRESVAFDSKLCLNLPDGALWSVFFDMPVQLTDVFGNLQVADFIGYCAVAFAVGISAYEMNSAGCAGLTGESYVVARKLATTCYKCFDNLEKSSYNDVAIKKLQHQVEGDRL